MAFGDNTEVLTDIEAAMGEVFNLKDRPQFNRVGTTTRYAQFRKVKMKGAAYHYLAMIAPSSNVRRQGFTAGRAGAFPAAVTDLKFQELSVVIEDQHFFKGPVKINIVDRDRTKGNSEAAYDLAQKVVTDLENDFGSQLNASLWQGGNCCMALVHTVYDTDGTTWSTGGATASAAYIRIKNGSIGPFLPGDVLDIYHTDGTTLLQTVKVNDVIRSKHGPTVGNVTTQSIGPGIIVTPTGDVALWNTAGTVAVGCFIARSGEFTQVAANFNNFHGLPDWWDPTVNVFRDRSGSLIDRDAVGYQWMMPEQITIAAAGAEVTLDLREHLKDLYDTYVYTVNTSQLKRKGGGTDGPSIREGLMLIGDVALIQESVKNANDVQFTAATSQTKSEAARGYWANVGFKGIVYNDPILGDIALAADIAAPPFSLKMIDWDSFFLVNLNGQPGEIDWVEDSGGRWRMVPDSSTQRPTFFLEAGAYTTVSLHCDCPATNVQISGVKGANQ
jgi:hypothetical protein